MLSIGPKHKGPKGIRRVKFGLCFVLVFQLGAAIASARGVNDRYEFRIEQVALEQAIEELHSQTEVRLWYDYDLAATTGINPVVGNYTISEALELMLAGTGLVSGLTESGMIVITRKNGAKAQIREEKVTSKKLRKSLLASVATFLFGTGGGQAATAQSANEDDAFSFDEIVVTAQKREQNIVDVPISMAVMGADELEALRVFGVEDYAYAIPNVDFSKWDRKYASLTIRGVSGDTGGQYSPTGVTVDGVSYGTVDTGTILASRFFDLETIEVLRGPQGTLTGANALGGIVNLVTVKPDVENFVAKATLDYGRFDTMFLQASLNTPLADNLAVRTVGYRETSNGAVKNLGPSGGSSSSDHFGGRVAVRWQPTENLLIDAAVSHEKLKYGIDDKVYLDQFDDTDIAGPGSDSEDRLDSLYELGLVGGQFIDPRTPIWGSGAGVNGGSVLHDYPGTDEVTSTFGSLHIRYDGGQHLFEFMYGFYDFEHATIADWDDTEFAFWAGDMWRGNKAHSIELRASSDYDGPFNWVAGLTWHDERQPYDEISRVGKASLLLYEEIDEATYYDPLVPDYLLEGVYENSEILVTKAAFANIFYDITEKLHLSAGLRFTQIDARYDDYWNDAWMDDISNMTRDQILDAYRLPLDHPDGRSDEINPRIALNYDIGENASAYVAWATGFRPGIGNDPRVVAAGFPETADPEYLSNYEIGMKGTFFNDRLNFAAAAFYMDYSDLQVGVDIEINNREFEYNVNAGKATIKGFELETALLVSSNLELRGTVGHTDSQVKELQYYEDVVPFKMPYTRSWNGTFSGIYSRDITDGLAANFRADLRWATSGTSALHPEDRRLGNQMPGYEIVDVSVGVQSDIWSLRFYFENILNEQYFTQQSQGTRPIAYFIPRAFGIRLTYEYGG